MRRKKERSKQGQINKAKQHSTPKAVTFPRKNELPQVGLEPTTLYTLNRALYHLYIYVSHTITHTPPPPPPLPSSPHTHTQLFDRLRTENPDAVNKVFPVAGDILQPDLGLKKEDWEMLQEKVGVVFHLAATIRFDSLLRYVQLL